jgi:beta-galactosidase
MSGEYGLKKDRDRPYFAGEFLWSGMDYIGEPTPYYDVFPVKSSFFGAVDTAGFPKDMYWLFRSQWTQEPMVHLLPMNWTDYKPDQNVAVWAYANVDTVELFLNGRSLGVKRFDHKTTADGRSYLETTECSGDDKTFSATDNPTCPGSYTSPNGSSGNLHLAWNVPFEPGKLVAVATKDGQEVARDEVDTAGAPDTVEITPDKRAIAADGHSLAYLTVDVVDQDGVMVPSADNELHFDVSGGRLVGLDNGQEESAENYKSSNRAAFNGKALAIIQSTTGSGPITVKVTSPGLAPQTATVFAGTGGVEPVYGRGPVGSAPSLPATVRQVSADGSSTTVPVTWNAPAALAAGLNTIDGSGGAKAYVTGYSVDHVAGVSTVIAAGTAPTLPGTADVVYTDGADRRLPVTWEAIPAAKYAQFGRFTVQGAVAGVAQKAVATITVSDLVSHNQNLGRVARLEPAADAGFTGSNSTLPAAMLDGTTATGGWSSFYNKAGTALLNAVSLAHASEWVSVSWPGYQTVGTLRPYFTLNAQRQLPAAYNVTYWDGSVFVPVKNLSVTEATASNQPTTLSFDPVNTNQVRLEMTSRAPGANNGFLQIAELEVNGELIQPTILDLKVNGRPVPGFDPAVSTYGPIPVQYNAPITVTGTPASDETVSFTPPASLPGDGIVTVKSGDGSATTTYTLHLIPADIDDGTVGGTVPATLSLTLGNPASFGAFTPGVAHDYTASTSANVISTAGDATLSVADPSPTATGHLVNGAFSLPQALQARATKADTTGTAFNAVGAGLNLLTWSAPVSNDPVTIEFKQPIAANDALRTGTYAKTLTFTLSTTTP